MAVPGSGDYGGMSEAQRNAIVEALLAQAYQQQAPPAYMYGDSVSPNGYPTDPADPADYSSPPSMSPPANTINSDMVGFNTANNPGTLNTGNLASQTDVTGAKGDFSGNHPGYSPSSFTAAPLGDFTSVNTTNDNITGAPIDNSVAQNQAAFDAMASQITGPIDNAAIAQNQVGVRRHGLADHRADR